MSFWRTDIDSQQRDKRVIDLLTQRVVPLLKRYFRAEVRGVGAIPEGPALFVANHSGGFLTPDTYLFCAAVYEEHGLDAVPYGLAHEVPLKMPLIGTYVSKLGGIRASHDGAHQIFQKKGKVLVYPGGDLDAFRPSTKRDQVIFGDRRGYIRLALREGVAIVPVVSAGSHDTWVVLSDGRWLGQLLRTHKWLRTDILPITFSLPWGLSVGAPLIYFPLRAKIIIEVLPAIRFARSGPDAAGDDAYVEACHTEVHSTMQAALSRLAREIRG